MQKPKFPTCLDLHGLPTISIFHILLPFSIFWWCKYPVGFAQPRHRAVRIERNGVSVNASVERRESISNASMLVSPRSLCQNAWFCILKLARRKRIKSFEKMHSRTPTNEQEHCDFFLKICTRKRRQIRPDGTQMSKKSWFGGVLGPCGGVLEPSGPENPPGCILRCENHVRGSPLGDTFWYNSGVFWCFFLLSFHPCAQHGIL